MNVKVIVQILLVALAAVIYFGYLSVELAILLLFTLLGIGFVAIGNIKKARMIALESWPTVEVIISDSNIHDMVGDAPALSIAFKYHIDGKSYNGIDQLTRNLLVKEPEGIKSKYAVGSEVVARYDPDSPGYAVVFLRDHSRADFIKKIGWVWLILMLIGSPAVIYILYY